MRKLKQKISDLWSSFAFWITGGTGRFTLGHSILLGLSIIVPIFLVMIAPFLGWIAIAPEHRYEQKYYWLQDFMIIWPCVLFGLMFISGLAYMIYNSIRDGKK